MECLNYTELRVELFINAIAPYTEANIGTILYGSHKLGINKHIAIIDAVHNYMMKSENVNNEFILSFNYYWFYR